MLSRTVRNLLTGSMIGIMGLAFGGIAEAKTVGQTTTHTRHHAKATRKHSTKSTRHNKAGRKHSNKSTRKHANKTTRHNAKSSHAKSTVRHARGARTA